jgi:hypothetical protein
MGIVQAVGAMLAITNAAVDLLAKSQAISQLIAQAQKEGRTTLTDEEWKGVIGLDDAARVKLDAAIKAAGG